MLVAFSVAPSGSGELSARTGAGDSGALADPDSSVSAAVAAAVRVVRASGLPHRTDAMFTTLEGEWDECLDVVKRACEAVGRHGDRVSLVLKADIRPGRTGEMQAKLDRLEAALADPAAAERRPGTSEPMRPDGP